MTKARPTIFTSEDDALIRACYSKMSSREIGERIGKTAKQIQNRANHLRLAKPLVHEDGAHDLPAQYDHRVLAAVLGMPAEPPGIPLPSHVTVHVLGSQDR